MIRQYTLERVAEFTIEVNFITDSSSRNCTFKNDLDFYTKLSIDVTFSKVNIILNSFDIDDKSVGNVITELYLTS